MKILAVDLSSVVRKYWEMHLDGKLTDNTPMRASVDYITRAREGFDRVVLALDVGPSFRKLHCPEYKAKRSDPGEPYRKCVADVVDRLAKDGSTFFPNKKELASIRMAKDGPETTDAALFYPEADDVIASLAAWYCASKERFGSLDDDSCLRIVSGDSDLCAVVNDEHRIEVCAHNMGDKIIHEADVREKFGGVGSWVTEVKALAGDDTDGYRPFRHPDAPSDGGREKPGIGLEGAKALLSQWGNGGGQIEGGADAVVKAALAGPPDGMPDGHPRRCLLAARGGGLEAGYACARMLTDLPLDFSRILAEPKIETVSKKVTKVEQETPKAEAPTVETSTKMVKYTPPSSDLLDPNALQPQTLPELFTVGEMVVNSRVHPHIDCPEKAMMVIAEARERRVPFGSALRNAYFVKGRLSWSASFLAGLVQRSDVCEVFEIVETTDEQATVAYKRRGRPERSFTFTIGEAKRAGWDRKSPDAKGDPKWVTNPRTMLRWAALREAARAFFPDVVSGMYTPDELRNGEVLDAEFEQTEGDFKS